MKLERPMLIKLTVSAALLLAVLWSLTTFFAARDAAAQATADVESCRQMARRIEQLSNTSNPGATVSEASEFLHRRSQESLQQLGVAADHLMGVNPGMPETIGQTAYKEVPTTITLRDLTLRQLVGFLLAMTGERSSLMVRSIHISAPHDAGGDVQWSVDVTLAHVIYESPPSVVAAE